MRFRRPIRFVRGGHLVRERRARTSPYDEQQAGGTYGRRPRSTRQACRWSADARYLTTFATSAWRCAAGSGM